MIEFLKYIIFLFVSDQSLSFLLKRVPHSKRKIAYLISLSVIIALFYNYIQTSYEENLYQKFNLERMFTQEQLRKQWRNFAKWSQVIEL